MEEHTGEVKVPHEKEHCGFKKGARGFKFGVRVALFAVNKVGGALLVVAVQLRRGHERRAERARRRAVTAHAGVFLHAARSDLKQAKKECTRSRRVIPICTTWCLIPQWQGEEVTMIFP